MSGQIRPPFTPIYLARRLDNKEVLVYFDCKIFANEYAVKATNALKARVVIEKCKT